MALSTPRTHRIRKTLLLATLSVAAGLLLAQRRSVTDSVLGHGSASLNAQSCIAQCAETANALTKTESATHTANVKACNGNSSCLAAEEARHEAAVASINSNRKACQNGCHQQGGAAVR